MKRLWTVSTNPLPQVIDLRLLQPPETMAYAAIDYAGDERTNAPAHVQAVLVFGTTQHEADTRAQAIVDALALAAEVKAAKPARQSLPREGATSSKVTGRRPRK